MVVEQTQVPNGSASCPRCEKRNYQYENGNFRCTSCHLLVDAIARPITNNGEEEEKQGYYRQKR